VQYNALLCKIGHDFAMSLCQNCARFSSCIVPTQHSQFWSLRRERRIKAAIYCFGHGFCPEIFRSFLMCVKNACNCFFVLFFVGIVFLHRSYHAI
jgi:hypothetical protein